MKPFLALVLSMIVTAGIVDGAFAAKAIPPQNGALILTSVDIANGATTSGAIDLANNTLIGILFPTSFTGTAVTFTVSDSLGGTYVPLYNASGAVSYTIAQARFYALNPADFYGVRFLKVVSGSTEGGARTVGLSLKGGF